MSDPFGLGHKVEPYCTVVLATGYDWNGYPTHDVIRRTFWPREEYEYAEERYEHAMMRKAKLSWRTPRWREDDDEEIVFWK